MVRRPFLCHASLYIGATTTTPLVSLSRRRVPASPYLVCQPPQPSIEAGRPYGCRRVQISAKASHQTFKEATGENSGLTRFNGRAQLASPPVQAIPALNFKPKSHCPHFQNTKANQHQPVSKPVPTCNYAYIFSVIAVLNSPENYPLDKA